MTADRTPCPQCHRPNSIKLKRCMYCGADLGGAADRRSRDACELRPSDTSYVATLDSQTGNDFFVSTGPFDGSEAGLAERYAAALGCDPYSARQQMLGRRPRVVARELTAEQAAGTLQRFLSAGLRAAAGTLTEVQRMPPPLEAIRVAGYEGGVLFDDDRGGQLLLAPTDLLLVVLGKVTTKISFTEEETRLRYHGGSLMVHAAPQPSRELRIKSAKQDRHSEYLVDLHPSDARPAVRIAFSHFDLASAAIDPGLHRGQAFDLLVQRVREWGPDEYFDNAFEAGLGDARAASPFWSHERKSDTRVADNRLAFDEYSRFYRVHLVGLIAGCTR